MNNSVGPRTGGHLPRAIFLLGPTASGKTDLAMALSDQLPVELISVDSALVYRGLDIGSAKPTIAELARYPHRLINICEPSERYSVGHFRRDALQAMAEITSGGKIPLLVGGTMLYFQALLQGIAELPEANLPLRAQLQQRARQEGWPALHRELAAIDPELAAGLDPRHSARIERGLEVYWSTGKTMTQLRREHREQQQESLGQHYQVQQLALVPRDRSLLHQRVEQRFECMLELGFVGEVEQLRDRNDLTADLPAMRAVGYRQVWQYLDGELDYRQMVARGVAATRQLVKRQLTWLRRWPDITNIYLQDASGGVLKDDEILAKALKFIT
ncbi:MAG: tRNA (adenosine(37)-N6)-dimethylallyltransferase MiaA [Gammaproteobacteria bacterium]|nr:tRNA (adenosine(37)-N6)-dimethylallyltransferase MiaA [Gammaproteobacteria bacterium]